MTALSAYAARLGAGLRETLRRHRRLLWPAAALLLLCVLSGPLLGAWMRWVELPRLVREADLQPCAETAASGAAGAGDATADAIVNALDAQETALAPRHCIGMRRIDTGTGLRTAAYRFEDGSVFTLHLRAPPPPTTQDDAQRGMVVDAAAGTAMDIATDAPAERLAEPGTAATAGTAIGIDAGNGTDTAIDPAAASAAANADNADAVPTSADTRRAPPAPPPILTATCPVQSRQSLLVLAGLLMVGVVVVLHRLRAGGRFLDFRNIVREPLRPGEALLLLYAFTLILGTGIGLQFGGCEAAEYRDAVKVDAGGSLNLQDLTTPMRR